MYHRARAERHGNTPEMLDAHFDHIARNHHNVLPGDPLAGEALNVCLSFDDGYFDFYAIVFPLLRKHGLRAVLAIPPLFVREATEADPESRRNVDSADAFAKPELGGFCTWREIEEMAQSPHVTLAAHGYSHQRLDARPVDLSLEVDQPQTILSARVGKPIEAFVFPFGRYSNPSLDKARQRYRHVFRIGGAMNRNWNGRVLYRVDADRMEHAAALFSRSRLLAYRARYFWNRLRGR
jgi:peptidoglycan/xylan/chitin deacetylase (PgdA/CDA1 family)